MRRRSFLLGLFVVAFLLRLTAVLVLRNISGPVERTSFGTDAVDHDRLARQVAAGNGYGYKPGEPSVIRPPGFPLFLAFIYLPGVARTTAAYLSFCALGALTCMLTVLLARELLSERAARLAGILNAFYVPHIYFATLFASENLFIACLALGVWQFIRHLKTGSLPALALCGLALGWAALTRPAGLLLLPFLGAVLLWSQLHRRRVRWRPWAVMIVVFLAPSLFWALRNYSITGKFWFVSTTLGRTFHQGNNPSVFDGPAEWKGHTAYLQKVGPGTTPTPTPDRVERDQRRLGAGLSWLRDNPGRIPRLMAQKFYRLWQPSWYTWNRTYVWVNKIGYTPYLLLMILGAFHCCRHRRYLTPPWLGVHATILATVVIALIFFGLPRFRDANTPVLMLYAVVGLRMLAWRALQRLPWLDDPRPEPARN